MRDRKSCLQRKRSHLYKVYLEVLNFIQAPILCLACRTPVVQSWLESGVCPLGGSPEVLGMVASCDRGVPNDV